MSAAASTTGQFDDVLAAIAPPPQPQTQPGEFDDVLHAILPPPKPPSQADVTVQPSSPPVNYVGVPTQPHPSKPNWKETYARSEQALGNNPQPIPGAQAGLAVAGAANLARGVQGGVAAWQNIVEYGRTLGAETAIKALGLPPQLAQALREEVGVYPLTTPQGGLNLDPTQGPHKPEDVNLPGLKAEEVQRAMDLTKPPGVEEVAGFAQIPGQMLNPINLAEMEAGGVAGRGVVAAGEGLGAGMLRNAAPRAVGAAERAVAGGANLGTYSALATPGEPPERATEAAKGAALGSLLTVPGALVALAKYLGHTKEVPNAQQVGKAGEVDGGVRPRDEVKEVPPQEGQPGVQPSGQGEPVPDGTPPQGVEPREVTAARARLDQAQEAMDEAKRRQDPAAWEQARADWQEVYGQYQAALSKSGLPLDARNPPSYQKPAPEITDEAPQAEQAGAEGTGTPGEKADAPVPPAGQGGASAHGDKPDTTGIAHRVSEGEPQQTSARKDAMTEDRASMGLDTLDSPERRGWQKSLDDAKEQGIHRKADRIAAEVNAKPRALNDTETAGLVVRATELKNEHKSLMDAIGKSSDAGEVATKSAEASRVEQEFDALSRALRSSGTEKGRALAAQKLTLDQDMSLISVKNRAKAAKGAELTKAESAKLEESTRQLEEANKKIADLEKQMSEQKAQQAIKRHQAGRRGVAHEARQAELSDLIAKARALLDAGCR